jgi:putative nucleotide binding protein
MGKKHTEEILDERDKEPFESFEDIKERIPTLPDPEKAIKKRIIKELTTMQRHNLFIQ